VWRLQGHEFAEWSSPTCGMFIYVKVKGLQDTRVLLDRCYKEVVAVAPGSFFSVTKGHSPCVRMAYSTATEEDIIEGVKRFARVVREFKASEAEC